MDRLEAGLERAVREAGALLKHFDRTSLALERKTGFDIVTEADLAAKAHLRGQLHSAPKIGFLHRRFRDEGSVSFVLFEAEREPAQR